jgi:hypothetical protein
MFSKKGQAALEYAMTYGWVALVLITVGFSLWYLGILSPASSPTGAAVGFSSVAPLESSCTNGPGGDTLRVSILNAAGTPISDLTMTVGMNNVSCAGRLPIGGVVICNMTSIDCGAGSAGDRFEVDIDLEYTSNFGTLRKSGGTVIGIIE